MIPIVNTGSADERKNHCNCHAGSGLSQSTVADHPGAPRGTADGDFKAIEKYLRKTDLLNRLGGDILNKKPDQLYSFECYRPRLSTGTI